MDTPKLGLLLIDTHSPLSLGISDFSQYPAGFNIVSPTLEITASGFGNVTTTFAPNSINIYTSQNLNIICEGEDDVPIPDGIYTIKYSIAPAYIYNTTVTFLRIDNLMEKFDGAFLKLDMLECDEIIKKQQQEELDTIYYYIQGAIAAGNNCAGDLSIKMYRKAEKMLNKFITNKCKCS